MITDHRTGPPHRPATVAPPTDDYADVRAYLHALPQPLLAPTLWPRLRTRRRSQRVASHTSLVIAAGSAAMALALALTRPEPSPVTLALAPVGSTGSASISGRATLAADRALVKRLHAIDRMLQDGYARGASTEQLAPLWHARERLASNSPAPLPARPVRL